jgi:hypothetical protein
MKAADQASMREDWARAENSGYLSQAARSTPVDPGEGGAIGAANVVRKAKLQLWDEQVEPVRKQFENESAPVDDVAQKIRDTVKEIDNGGPHVAKATERFAKQFDKDMTVGQMFDAVKTLNNNKSVSRYYDMTGAEQSQSMLADPALRAKVEGLSALRDKLFDVISDKWGPEEGAQFKEFRKEYGALGSVEARLRDTKVPTPAGLPTRLMNTVRTVANPKTAGVTETLGNLNNPNRLAVKAINSVGDRNIPAPPPPQFPEQQPSAAATTATAPSGGLPSPPMQPPPSAATGWFPEQQPAAAPMGTSRATVSAGGNAFVQTELSRLGMQDTVMTPREAKTVETMMRGPRWKGMDPLDRVGAVHAVLRGSGGQSF